MSRNRPGGHVALIAMLAVPALLVTTARPAPVAAYLPERFTDEVVWSGLNNPTVMQFADDGRVFVGEKRGIVRVFDSLTDATPSTFLDLRTNTYNFWDRGLLGLALAPGFPADPYVYVLYTHDAPIGGQAPTFGTAGANSDPCPTPPGPTEDGCVVSTRLSRFAAVGGVAGPEQVLVEDWCQQFPSHSAGSLVFGTDGALYASGGEGADFNALDHGQSGDPLNPCGDPPGGVGAALTLPAAEGGSLRSQDLTTPGDPVGLGGTIIRIDPLTGAGMPDNPNAGSPDANARRIIAIGGRNPMRMTLHPETGDLWVGDVGWNSYEEIDRLTAPASGEIDNLGWPCYEGPIKTKAWDALDVDMCENLYAQGPAAVLEPVITYQHDHQLVAGDGCPYGSASVTGLAFYPGGGFPAEYDGALFLADYSRKCVYVMFPDAGGVPDATTVQLFASGNAGAVDLKVGPDGNLYLVELETGTIRRIVYQPDNYPPIAHLEATPTQGHAPLAVTFSAAGSSDAEDGALTYEWDLDGDGQLDDSTDEAPSHEYTTDGDVTVTLRVTDAAAATATATTVVHVGNSAPVPLIATPAEGATWKVGDVITFAGGGTDTEDGPLPATATHWTLVLQHCSDVTTCHAHQLQEWDGVAGGSFVAPDHEYPSFLDLHLTVTDSNGLSSQTVRRYSPQTVTVRVESYPAQQPVTVGDVTSLTPFTFIAIVGSSTTVTAPTSHTIDNIAYAFAYWSDGGDRSHPFVAPADTHVLTLHSLIATLSGSAQPAAPALRLRCDLPHQPQVTCPTG